MTEQEVLFSTVGAIGRIHLNQPASFNALTREMCQSIRTQLLAWAEDDTVAAVLVTAEGVRAFCAGGDIRALYEAARGDWTKGLPFFWDEYRLDAAVHHFPKPYIALVDGIVMGGGVGISVHGSHRVVTERATFAMPETGIGLFPDVGATWFLPRWPGGTGMYLGLTGARLKAADALYVGFGTHYVPSARLDELAEALAEADLSGDAGSAVDAVLAAFTADTGAPDLADHRPVIDTAFAAGSVEAIIEALRAEDGYFAIETADTIGQKSPTSLKVTFAALRLASAMSFNDAIRMEYRMVAEMLRRHDFFEGIRAAVIDKDRKPKWRPNSLAAVSDADVEAHFRPLGEDELRFD